MIRLIFSDMDGTLLDENGRLPEEFGVSSDQEPGSSLEVGDVIFNPIPRPRSN